MIFFFSGFPELAEANVQLECVMTRLTGKEMKAMSVDELWSLRDKVSEQLLARIAEEKRLLEERLRRLRSVRPQEKSARRPYPKVLPKFRNPAQPYQTWAGRGKQPRWLAAQLRTGKRIEDFLIAHQERRKRTR